MGKKPIAKSKIRQIVYLRKRGRSLPEIRRLTGCGNSTAFKYIKGVEILPKFKEFWSNKRRTSTFRFLQQQQKAREQAGKLIRMLGKRERIIVATCLYWAEGAKRDFSLTNTDPVLIKTFINCLAELGIEREMLSINLRIFEDLDRKEACSFWSKVTGVPRRKIMYIDVRKGKKKGKLPYGMCRVRVIKGGYFLKLLNALREVIVDNISPRSSVD